MTKKVFQIDIVVVATAYIKADSAEEAMKIAQDMKHDALELVDQDGEVPISGKGFDDPDLPDVSLSPCMTLYGPADGTTPELSHDPDAEEGEGEE